MAARVTVVPAPFNSAGLSVFPTYSAPGVDAVGAGGTNFATAWPGTISGVIIPNQGNGAIWLYYVAGTTAPGVTQVLVGDLIGNTGQVAPATTEQFTLALSTSGWLGPWSPATYNQQQPGTAVAAGMINATALTAAAQGCVVVDFTVTTTLCVRAYQSATVSP
jgi:hypothetical protein